MSNYVEVTPKEAERMLVECMKAGLTCMIHGSPGIGKSSIVKSIAEKYSLEFIDLRLSTCDITDLSGLPNFDKEGNAYFAPFKVFPVESTPIPENKKGFLLFLDEFNGASKAVQLASYKLILDRQVGQYDLHPLCFIVCAGNLDADNAITNELSTAVQSRLVHINMTVDFTAWMNNVAIKENYDPRIIAYLNDNQKDLMNFDPEHTEQTFACPRTWSFVNSLIKDTPDLSTLHYNLIAGCLGISVGSKFYTYTKIFKDIYTFEEICAKGASLHIPRELNKQWALISICMANTTKDNIDKVLPFVDKFDTSFRIWFYRAVFANIPELKTNTKFLSKIVDISKYLFGSS